MPGGIQAADILIHLLLTIVLQYLAPFLFFFPEKKIKAPQVKHGAPTPGPTATIAGTRAEGLAPVPTLLPSAAFAFWGLN